MGKHSAAGYGRDASTRDLDRNSTFQRELARARQHLEKLEAEQLRQDRFHVRSGTPRFDEAPAFATTCNALIWVVVALPFVIAVVALVRRLID